MLFINKIKLMLSSGCKLKPVVTAVSLILLTACGGDNVKSTADDSGSEMAVEADNSPLSQSEKSEYKEGLTALYNNDLSSAQSIFTRFIRNRPQLAGAYSNLALLYIKQDKTDEALKLVNKAIKLNPKQAHAHQLRGQLNVKLGKIHDAKTDYLKAVELKPDYAVAHYNLALLYDIYLQEIQLAINHYETYMGLLKKPDEATKDWISHLKGTLANG